MKNNKKIKIHVKNNHWAPGSFPTDEEGEKNFTITKNDFDKAIEIDTSILSIDQQVEKIIKLVRGRNN